MPDPSPSPRPADTPQPCPYPGCGWKVMTVDSEGPLDRLDYFVVCPDCGACGPAASTPALATSAWNLVAGQAGELERMTERRNALFRVGGVQAEAFLAIWDKCLALGMRPSAGDSGTNDMLAFLDSQASRAAAIEAVAKEMAESIDRLRDELGRRLICLEKTSHDADCPILGLQHLLGTPGEEAQHDG